MSIHQYTEARGRRPRLTIEDIEGDIGPLDFHVPPKNQGQIVEVAYALAGDYGVVERRVDRSDRSVGYSIHPWTRQLGYWAGSEGPWNSSPPTATGWKNIQGRRPVVAR